MSLARRNLFHDKVRLAVTLTGVAFSVVLVAVQLGIFLGFRKSTTDLITNSGADLWVASTGTPYLEMPAPMLESSLYRIMTTPGVKRAERLVAFYGTWKRRDGQCSTVMVIGFDLESGLGGPWNIVKGRPRDLRMDSSVIVDELYADKLGFSGLHESAEINGRRARVVGITTGIRTFTTLPYAFTSYRNAVRYSGQNRRQTMYILVEAEEGCSVQVLQSRLRDELRDVSIHTRDEFTRQTSDYWMFSTGAGMAVLFTACMGLVVGVAVVSQTIYSTTMEHIREFGTLKAIGATNFYLYKVIVKQASISAVIGYALGMCITSAIVWQSRSGSVNIQMPIWLCVSMFFVTLAMCIAAALVSINKVTRIDPVLVFKQ